MVAATVAISAASCSPNPASACTPTIRQMPAIPANTPNSFRKVTGSWRVTASVRKKAKIGEVELRMVASPASSERSPQAISVQGMTLLRQAWNRKRRQVAASRGSSTPRAAHHREQQQSRDQRSRRDQGDRRNGGDAELDETVRAAPQRREQQQQRQLGGDGGMLRRVWSMSVVPALRFEAEHYMAGNCDISSRVEVSM